MKPFFLSIVFTLLFSQALHAVEPDWSAYAALLKHVKQAEKHGTNLALVDYSTLKTNGILEQVYQQISHYPVNTLNGRNETLAFYINSYNILALKMVVDHWPVESIKDNGNFFSPVWGKVAGNINHQDVSLDDIENKMLRPMGEPRIHLAIVCASVSCPDLNTEPYTAARLEQQLNQQTTLFLNNAKKGLLLTQEDIVISKIFHWFKEDFDTVGGVETFIRHYRPDLPQHLSISADIDYDWSVNGY